MNNEAMMVKIQALLAQAEHPNTGEVESLTFLVKAQQLMAENSIDEATARHAGERPNETPITSSFYIYGPHAKAKRLVLNGIGKSNGCRVIGSPTLDNGNLWVHVAGFKSDVDATKTMFMSVLIIGHRDLINALKLEKRKANAEARKAKAEGHYYYKRAVHGGAFAPSFWTGFANTLARRLSEANRASENEATERVGNSVALALIDRSEQIENHILAEFGKLMTQKSVRLSSYAGFGAGGQSAARVNLNKGVGAGGTRALNS
jgi:hypothetical protein